MFDEKIAFVTANYKRKYKLIMNLIPNEWKHVLRTENSQKIFSKAFYNNGKDAKYKKPFKLILWPNFLEGQHILIPKI